MATGMISMSCKKNQDNDRVAIESIEGLPLMETFLSGPIRKDNIKLWVPVDKIGPIINRSCQPRNGCNYSCNLPAHIEHEKTNDCPPEVGRLLAESVWLGHKNSLPLTQKDGWQWEYSYSLSQFQEESYNLPRRGGSWENCYESIMHITHGVYECKWLEVSSAGEYASRQQDLSSDIIVKTYSSIRTRHGYPKERVLSR